MGGDADQAGRGEETEKITVVIDSKSPSVPTSCCDEKFKLLKDAFNEHSDVTHAPKIRRVPHMIKDREQLRYLEQHLKFPSNYEPRVIAVGPLHHFNPNLKPAEKLKYKLAKNFMDENGEKEIQEGYLKIKNQINDLTKYYENDDEAIKLVSDKEEDLAWIFFVDGCAMLHYMKCFTDQEKYQEHMKTFNINNHTLAFIHRDLLLLENQLPYEVLELLINSSKNASALREGIKEFIDQNMMTPIAPELNTPQQEGNINQNMKTPVAPEQTNQQQEDKPHHLLDLLRKRLLAPKRQQKASGFCKRLMDKYKINQKKTKTPSFRNVKELQAAGIKLRPLGTQESRLTDASFSRMFCIGKLELHPFAIDDSTAPKLLNLVAYEMCPDFKNELEITSYVCFLDSLIDEPGDVKELRDAGILKNAMGSDEEVARLFNEISTDLVPNPQVYTDVEQHIQDHCDNKLVIWIAQFLYEHFSTPWTFLAFLGAIIALALTFVQTWYAIP